MPRRTIHRVVGVWALVAMAASAHAAAVRCDVALLRGLGISPETLLACVRAVAARPRPADGVSGELLRASLGALSTVSFTRPAPDEPTLARQLVAELRRRGASGPDDHPTLRDILLQNGRLDEAAADRTSHPVARESALPAQRPIRGPRQDGEARYWRWDERGTVLVEQAVDLAHGKHLVVESSPGCHFCERAATDIDRDPTLARLFDGSLWITRPEQGLAPAYWASWKATHPAHPLVVVLDTQGWALSSEWSTPRFRMFVDGREVASVLGWTPASRAALLDVARAQGLLPAP